MKKLELKGMQMLNKEQMKKISGGEVKQCTLDCYNYDDYYIGSATIDSEEFCNDADEEDLAYACGGYYDTQGSIAYCTC